MMYIKQYKYVKFLNQRRHGYQYGTLTSINHIDGKGYGFSLYGIYDGLNEIQIYEDYNKSKVSMTLYLNIRKHIYRYEYYI